MLENDVRGDVVVHLVTSRDGRRWQQPFPREAFIPQGPKGSWYDNIIWWPSMIVHSNKMLFYYSGARYKHMTAPQAEVDSEIECLNKRSLPWDERQSAIQTATFMETSVLRTHLEFKTL